ncbi:MAG TPA: hypothetical protein DEQ34_13825, partial [Balneolaceae bacterium]|nr:hypothetical protein [Balneolaceae bacterium]
TPQFKLAFNQEVISQFIIYRINAGYNSYEYESANSFRFTDLEASTLTADGIVEMELMMSGTDNGAEAFVDYLELKARRQLLATSGKLSFFLPADGSVDEFATYQMSGFNGTPIALDVTDPVNPRSIEVTASGSNYNLLYHTDGDSRIIAQSSLQSPLPGRKIDNQNLHGTAFYPDYIIVTNDYFMDYANELANYRAQDGLTPLVVTQSQILNEFSSGITDPTAIRDFIKYLWDLAIDNGQEPPKYLLLFGDTSFDTKNIIDNSFTNFVLTYQSAESIHRTQSYGTDDYFGHLDDNEGLFSSADRVDLGIGRISAQTRSEARIALDKIYRYENPDNNGDWQNLFTFAGDDDFPDREENRDLHVLNADGTAERMDIDAPGGRFKKIYLFSYPEEITGAGRQLPGATSDFMNTLNSGTLVMNYSGHGNMQTLADEELFISDNIPDLTNRNKLTLLVTATCQFGRYDDAYAQSGAEKLVFAENGGAIGSFTTTRVVYTNSSPTQLNFGINVALSQKMLERDEEGRPLRLGDIFVRTKNTSIGSEINARKFILLGDPAVRFALPNRSVTVTSINDQDLGTLTGDLTIKALDEVKMKGAVTSSNGEILSDFNGEATITFYDAPRRVSIPMDLDWVEEIGCYLNRGTEYECTYQVQTDILFKGKVQVTNGEFDLDFIIPKDISFSEETGRIIVYAKDTETTAGGSYTDVVFNGINEIAVNDGKGPELDVFLNDQSFLNGSLANGSPKLIVELADSSGINTTGTGVGHEIIATIDTKPQQNYVLNNFYEGALNDYTRGRIEYPLEEIPEGSYTLKVRAWDVHNNPAEKSIFFEVAPEEDLVVDHVYNYPNPMNNFTSFTFEHNQQGNPLDVDIRIYTLSGKLVQHKKEQITTSSSYASISWNGRDRDNDRLGNGTYIYVLRVTADTPEGRSTTEKIEKLVIIR